MGLGPPVLDRRRPQGPARPVSLPYTDETVGHVATRVREVQDFLGRQTLLENVSSYVSFRDSEMSEWNFLSEIARRADCHVLLDVNNIYVSKLQHCCAAGSRKAGYW